jgi:hypothetical protein
MQKKGLRAEYGLTLPVFDLLLGSLASRLPAMRPNRHVRLLPSANQLFSVAAPHGRSSLHSVKHKIVR